MKHKPYHFVQISKFAHYSFYAYCEEIGSPVEWIEARGSCLKEFLTRHDQLSIGFCACCSFTTSDFVYNGLHSLQVEDMLEANRPVGSSAQELSHYFKPRPQDDSMHWFPTVTFKRKAADKPWNMKLSNSMIQMTFSEAATKIVDRKNSAAMATICVQAMGYSNWPNGVKCTIFGPCDFGANAYGSHDIKRGALLDLAFSGEHQ